MQTSCQSNTPQQVTGLVKRSSATGYLALAAVAKWGRAS